jgi:N-glycosylase/DNA lyase
MGHEDAMRVELGTGGLAVLDIDLGGPINLAVTLECGQAFRWRQTTFPCRPDLVIAFEGVIRQLAVIVGQKADVTSEICVAYDPLYAGGVTLGSIIDSVRSYFSVQDDVQAIEESVRILDPVMSVAVEQGHGLRLLQQDHWESLASFVLSANNSIPNIARIVENLAACLGDPVGLDRFGFPPPDKIACQESTFLRQSKCGFRDRYLKDAAERVESGEVDLVALERMPTEQARERLMRIRGVGPKVADCVLLFGYHRLEVFPTDVWIGRAMSRFYLDGRAVTPKVAREEGMRRFGLLAGYAQEYLFFRIRGD